MKLKTLAVTGTMAALVLAGCSTPDTTSAPPSSTSSATSGPTSTSAAAPTVTTTAETTATVVRFTRGSTHVDVTVGPDSPAVRDFLSMLPLTLTVKEFAGREKIANLPRPLAYTGSPGSDPRDGDLIYFTPWGNLGFYYNTEGIGYSDQTLHLGTYRAPIDTLERLEGQSVTVEIAR